MHFNSTLLQCSTVYQAFDGQTGFFSRVFKISQF